jgi:hypothetical protein
MRPDRARSKCGPHVELVANDAARVTRCTCGTLHVHVHANGVTLRLSPDSFRHVANALGAAANLLSLTDAEGPAPGETVN